MHLRTISLIFFLSCAIINTGYGQESQILSKPGQEPEVHGLLVKPDTPGPHPAVIILYGSSGWRPPYVAMAKSLADSGYVALVLDYYADALPEADMANVMEMFPLWREALRGAATFLKEDPSVAGSPVGILGFSLGGFLAVSTAGSMPEVNAVVEFFGGAVDQMDLESQVHDFPPLLILHGEEDEEVPVSKAYELRDAVMGHGGTVEMTIYPGALHGFNAPWIPAYNDSIAQDASQKTFDFFNRYLTGDLLTASSSATDFVIREEMVPMRDGVSLYTLVISPKDMNGRLPVILERTPYKADGQVNLKASSQQALLGTKFMGSDYIYVFQDIRGRYRSEGDFRMYRVPRGDFNKTETDETTDAWDTVDWIVKNLNTNGKVGIWGTSYPGWLTLAAMRDPHPALTAAVPFNPVVDVWKADDWYHWGAFRGAYAFSYIYEMETKKGENTLYPYKENEMYSWQLPLGALGPALGSRLDERHEMWDTLMKYPEYGPYWKAVAADRWFSSPPRLVPALHVHGLWDQEDIYGSPHAYAALERLDRDNNMNFFAAGPWYHGQHFGEGSHLGDIQFGENTSLTFREEVLSKFLRHFLHEDGTPLPAPVTVFETGTNEWRTFDSWPHATEEASLYLRADGKLAFTPPSDKEAFTGYVSDPAHPVPYEPRPIWEINYDNPPAIAAWRSWLVQDQRFVDGRPDVATWVSEPLTEPLTVRGPVLAKLFAETTGSDADWVVKLIDVYGDIEKVYEMSGFQLMISGDIFRGRYREDYEQAHPIEPDAVLEYEIPLPQVNHTFLPGHRIMVQVQSSWFPLYDLNPQTWVPSIMTAPDSAYKAQRHRIHHSAEYPTSITVLLDRE